MLNAPALLISLALASTPRPGVDFDTQIIPLLTKAGCNSGACHGAAVGRGGFRLSLFGSNPSLDYERIVHELEGRRINLARPVESLLIEKPTEQISHEGGTRFDFEGPQAALLVEWIRAGAPRLQRRELEKLEISPREVRFTQPEQSQPLRVVAHFSDSTQEDVTGVTVLTSTDEGAVRVGPQGDVQVLRRGLHTVMLRYLDQVEAVRVLLPYTEETASTGLPESDNFIDEEIVATLAELQIPLSPAADDAELLRRTYLDLTGRLPTPEEVKAWLADDSPDRHARLVDRLLASDAFVDYWTLWWAQLLRVESQSLQKEGARTYHAWLREQVAANRPVDEMVRELLLATGDSYEQGPANFFRVAAGPRERAEFLSEALLGTRLRCANCHDHPLDRWTQDDYHGLAAILARLDGGRVVELTERGEVTHPRTGEPALPRIPGERFLDEPASALPELADWLVSADNDSFARSIVNRVWQRTMGRGLVEPVDDLRATNPPTHPELLDRLARNFLENGCDLRRTIRRIVTSEAYARSSRPLPGNAADSSFYSHAIERPLPPEVLADAITDVTGVAETYGGEPAGTRAVALFDGRAESQTLDVLGRCVRTESCEPEPAAGDLSRTLHLINGPLLNERLRDPEGRLHRLLAEGRSDQEILSEFYLRALSRYPTDAERQQWLDRFADLAGSERSAAWEDFVWALLCSREFGMRR
ncbi:hypothetical protein Mal4_19930 [Maioricimonas rarisocia]|uniref:Planctomycete cytochrome C n=1 Tax=Maioricimonas rarisocia TaxID=2528026 RepID=A0A517Z5E3_9PLAN|nr:DUF1549 and DUF1553 domain-containing protein [Maioricimonas rarisocia]QDU37677.1 hypothetical protein Mal4_19930 [Maioricimonas rarisocia]